MKKCELAHGWFAFEDDRFEVTTFDHAASHGQGRFAEEESCRDDDRETKRFVLPSEDAPVVCP